MTTNNDDRVVSEAQRRNEALASRMRQRQRPTPASIRMRLASPPQAVPGTPQSIPPKPMMGLMDAMINITSASVVDSPVLATEDQVAGILKSWDQGESLRSAEAEPWRSIVGTAVRAHDLFFGTRPFRLPIRGVSPFPFDNLPETHGGFNEDGELLPTWDSSVELDVRAVVSAGELGHRWLLRGAQTLESVIDVVRKRGERCDLGDCRIRRPDAAETQVFAHGDLIVLARICSQCWQSWTAKNLPEPPEEMIYEADIEQSE